MKKEIKSRYGFTLIELLVVITIIALLVSILMPALSKAKSQARAVVCKSNMSQIGKAMNVYAAQFNFDFTSRPHKPGGWGLNFDAGQTGYYPHEWQPPFSYDLFKNRILQDYEVFFCPSIKNLSYKQNYRFEGVSSGNDYSSYKTEDLVRQFNEYTSSKNEYFRPLFWSVYTYIYKKTGKDSSGNFLWNVNNVSKGAMMVDLTEESWDVVKGQSSSVTSNINNLNIDQTYWHYNVLMDDCSVQNPGNRTKAINQWLWGTDFWAPLNQ